MRLVLPALDDVETRIILAQQTPLSLSVIYFMRVSRSHFREMIITEILLVVGTAPLQ